jgi:hypothetical protein
VKGGVEDCDLRHARQRLARSADLLERAPVVERSQDGQLRYRALDLVVHEHRSDETATTLHHTVPDRVRGDEVLDRVRLGAPHEVKLEARGARVDDKHIHRREFS